MNKTNPYFSTQKTQQHFEKKLSNQLLFDQKQDSNLVG